MTKPRERHLTREPAPASSDHMLDRPHGGRANDPGHRPRKKPTQDIPHLPHLRSPSQELLSPSGSSDGSHRGIGFRQRLRVPTAPRGRRWVGQATRSLRSFGKLSNANLGLAPPGGGLFRKGESPRRDSFQKEIRQQKLRNTTIYHDLRRYCTR